MVEAKGPYVNSLEENWQKRVLANGMSILHAPLPHDERLYLGVVIKAGSRYEATELAGASHFLEHMMFRGSKAYPSFAALADAFEWLGGEWNAATSHEYTEYSYSGSKDSLAQAVALFADFIQHPLLLEFEKERQVILREIDEELNDYGHSTDVHWHMSALLWPGSHLAHPITGTSASVKRLKLKEIEQYRQAYYHPLRMGLCVVGGAADPAILDLLESHFSSYHLASSPLGAEPQDPPATFQGPACRLVEHSDSQYNILLSFHCEGEWSERSSVYELINYMMIDGFSSRLPLRLREQLGLVYDVDAHLSLFSDRGSFDIGAAVNCDQVLTLIKETCLVLARFKSEGPRAEELAKAKFRAATDLKLIAHRPATLGFRLTWHSLCGQPLGLAAEQESLARIEAADIQRVAAELFQASKCGLILLGPKEKGLEEKALTLIRDTLT